MLAVGTSLIVIIDQVLINSINSFDLITKQCHFDSCMSTTPTIYDIFTCSFLVGRFMMITNPFLICLSFLSCSLPILFFFSHATNSPKHWSRRESLERERESLKKLSRRHENHANKTTNTQKMLPSLSPPISSFLSRPPLSPSQTPPPEHHRPTTGKTELRLRRPQNTSRIPLLQVLHTAATQEDPQS